MNNAPRLQRLPKDRNGVPNYTLTMPGTTRKLYIDAHGLRELKRLIEKEEENN